MSSEAKVRVLSIQTTLLGNRTYGGLLRRAFADSARIEFDAHWSSETHDERSGFVQRQLTRAFLKMVERPYVRRRNLDVFPLRFEIGTSYRARIRIGELLRTRRPDVVHVHSQALAWFCSDVMARIPTILSADGTSYQMAAQQLEPRYRWTFAANHLFERRALRRAAAVVVFSQWAADSMIADHGIDPARISVIPPGIDIAKFPERSDARDDSDPFRILFVGGEFERKGGLHLVDVFLSRFGEAPGVELHVVTKSTGVPKHPRIHTYHDVDAYSERWFDLYARCDAFVMPTKRDQSPIVFLEAMASGLPVVTTPVGSAPEVVLDGATGYIVPSGDARALGDRIEGLVADRALGRAFGAAGRARVALRYEATKNARALEELFVEVARRSSSRHPSSRQVSGVRGPREG